MANSTTLYTGADARVQVDVTENKTLTAADCGIVQNVITDAITITLPAMKDGLIFRVRNGGVPASSGIGAGSGADASCLVTVAPNASDAIEGLAFTAADNKAALNTKATAKVGDFIEVMAGNSTASSDGWTVTAARGTWARQS